MRGILTYHSIDPSGSPISVSPEAFRRHVRWLASGKVPVVPLPELLRGPTDVEAVAVTFDDAFSSFAEIAWPMLREHGIPATVFVPTGHAGRTNRWPDETYAGIPELPLLGWDALARLAGEGVALESHAVSHRDLRRLDDRALAEELTGAADRIATVTGRRPSILAYPYGFADARVAAAASSAYSFACTDEFRLLGRADDPRFLPRLDAYYFQTPGILERWGSPVFAAYVAARGFGRRLRRALTATGEPHH
ncbi:MAG: polysaccharide deacetylase family protein [Candidatus Eiseniibacteriota bacterium]